MSDVLTINVSTGERTERDFTTKEIERRAADQAAFKAEAAQIEERATALESGRAKLLALGLTESEVEAMTNG